MSRQRLASTASFQAGRMIGVAVPRWIACNCADQIGDFVGRMLGVEQDPVEAASRR